MKEKWRRVEKEKKRRGEYNTVAMVAARRRFNNNKIITIKKKEQNQKRGKKTYDDILHVTCGGVWVGVDLIPPRRKKCWPKKLKRS